MKTKEFYTPVSRAGRVRGNARLWLALGAAIVMIVLVIIPIIWGGWYQRRWWRFVGDLSESTTYAYTNDCLRANYKGQAVWVEGDSIYGPYQKLTDAGRGRLLEGPPEGEPDIGLIYGDGSCLYLWRVKLEGYQDPLSEYGVAVSYVDREGERFTYDTDRAAFEALCEDVELAAGRNRPWPEKGN